MLGSLGLTLPTLLLLVAPLYVLLTILSKLHKNYLIAKSTKLPIILVPFAHYDPTSVIISFLFAPLLRHFHWARIMTGTWTWEDNDAPSTIWGHGETFMTVGPNASTLLTSDKLAIEYIMSKRKEFVKPDLYKALDFYGKNVDTVNGVEWELHRKLTGPCFNERASGEVWDEAGRQAMAMVEKWVGSRNGIVRSMAEDTRVVALHVLDAAGFGVQNDFFGGVRDPAPGHKLSRKDALMVVLDNLTMSIIVAPYTKVLGRLGWVCGKKVSGVVQAVVELGRYIDEAVEQDRKAETTKANLISTLIRTVDRNKAEERERGVGAGSSTVRFADEEIKGNIFIFNFAGHDTTANTLAYAFGLLACYPEVQDWVVEEIDAVVGAKSQVDMVYEEVFPKLKRVKAVMYETLRLYGPAPRVPRVASASSQTTLPLSNPSRTITIPPKTDITLRLHAMHTSASNFPDPTAFKPDRWITPSPSSSVSSDLSIEEFISRNVMDGYAAWSYGPRICPGKQFSIVEFVSVLSTVLAKVTLRPSVGEAEGGASDFLTAQKQVLRLLRDSGADGPTLRMNRPEELCLKVEKRRGRSDV